MNFLADYLFFNSGNEVNAHYHQWSALGALATAVSRKVWIDQGYFNVYPGFLYVVLLGPPGNHKTTAMSIAKRLLREAGEISFSAECQSKEKLVAELATMEKVYIKKNGEPFVYTPYAAYVTELSQFIGIDPVKMIDFLVTVYDSEEYDQKTQKHDHQIVNGPCFTLLACTTLDWVLNYLKSDIISGGFSRRAVFVLEDWESSRRVPRPQVTPEMKEAYKRCVQRITYIHRNAFGKFEWTPEAQEWFDHWYTTRTMSSDPNVAPFDLSNDNQVLKVAMLLELATNDEMKLTVNTLQVALAMVDKVMASLPTVFSGLGRNQLAAVTNKFEMWLMKQGVPVPLREAKAFLWSNAQSVEIMQILEHMRQVGKLTLQVDQNTGQTWVVLTGQASVFPSSSQPSVTPPASTEADSPSSVDPPVVPS